MIYAQPGATFEATVSNGTTGKVGTIGVRLQDGQGATTLARTTAGIVESPAGSGIYTATLAAPATAGQYVVVWDTGGATPTWASEDLTVLYTPLIAVGSSASAYFTVAEARKVKPLDNATKYPDADIDAMRVAVEEALEHACGVAFVPRTTTDRYDGNGGTDLLLDWTRPRTVSACTVDGTSLAAGDLAALVTYRDGRVYGPNGWNAGRGNVSITYTHGYDIPPGRVKRAAILLTKRFLVDTPINDRATQLVNEDGTTQWFVTAGVRGAIFDVPEANAVVAEYGVRASVG